jgi:hypothetical protein
VSIYEARHEAEKAEMMRAEVAQVAQTDTARLAAVK